MNFLFLGCPVQNHLAGLAGVHGGEALLEVFDAHALWVDREGQITYSPGFESYTNP